MEQFFWSEVLENPQADFRWQYIHEVYVKLWADIAYDVENERGAESSHSRQCKS